MRTSAWRMMVYALIVFSGVLAALPNAFTREQLSALPPWFPKQQVALGLDLRGGAQVVLELDSRSLIAERAQDLMRQAREALKQAGIKTAAVRLAGTTTEIELANPQDSESARRVLGRLASEAGELNISSPSQSALRLVLSQAGEAARISAAAEQSLEIVRHRIDGVGLAEPSLQRLGKDRISLQLPGITDMKRIEGIIKNTAKLSFHMVRGPDEFGHLPPGVSWHTLSDKSGRVAVEDRPMIAGDRLADAGIGSDQVTGEPTVTFRFDAVGAHKFAEITRENVGRQFAVLLDDAVLTAPVIETPIIGGTGQIKGRFTTQSAADLSALLRAGALTVKMTIVEQHTVGPDAGRQAIESGIKTGLIGFALVIVFITLLYGRWGLLANAALILNVILTIAALTLLGATLTLPGIAGMVLGVGLAVDANVLINERIREETRKGLSAMAALNAGFNRAFATIVDANLTAIIATALLILFGTGPVRGFAVTMGLGIAISMFTAVTVVRVAMSEIVRRWKLKTLVIEPVFGLKLVPDGTSIPFMRARMVGLALSAALSVASLALMIHPGLNYGVDFKGGIEFEVTAAAPVDLAKLHDSLAAIGEGNAVLQEAGSASHILVRAEQHVDAEAAADRVRTAIAKAVPGAQIHGDVIGPRVSSELATTGILAVALASLAMTVYIWARFEWPFAVGAMETLVLDVTKTAGFFALTGTEFNLTAIAAVLTLIGYSVNDKVVVYDRMRENMRRYKAMPLREIIDLSINETLGRSLYTSTTALIALLPMAIWGGPAVASFAPPIVFGIVVAALSSVFIAAPILLYLGDWRRRRGFGPPATAPAPA